MNKYTNNSSKRYVLDVHLKYPKELRKLHSDYVLALHKTAIKREMLYGYQLKIAVLYNISVGNVKKLVPNFLDKEKDVNRSRKKNDVKDEKALYKLMNNAVYRKTMEDIKNRIDVKLGSNKKYYLKWASKLSYMLIKIFEND